MSWFKVTDTLMTDEKVMMMPLHSRGMALGTWVACGTWSTQHTTDGKIPAAIAEAFVGTLEGAETLVEARMWKRIRGGFQFNKWDKYQFTREQIETKRNEDRERKADWRAARGKTPLVRPGNVPHVSQRDTAGTNAVSSTPVPSRPDPTRPDKKDISSEVATATSRPDEKRSDVEAILDNLEAAIAANDAKVPTRGKNARDAIRLMLDRDGRTPDQINAAIEYATTDEFWRANILSAAKLREKFDQLRLSAQRGKWKPTDRHQRDADFWENEMAASQALDQGTMKGIES